MRMSILDTWTHASYCHCYWNINVSSNAGLYTSLWLLKGYKCFVYSTGERPQRPLSTPHLRAVAAPQPTMRHSRTQADFLETQLSDHHHRRQERSEQFRQVKELVKTMLKYKKYYYYKFIKECENWFIFRAPKFTVWQKTQAAYSIQ